jgi:hypothetical protein
MKQVRLVFTVGRPSFVVALFAFALAFQPGPAAASTFNVFSSVQGESSVFGTITLTDRSGGEIFSAPVHSGYDGEYASTSVPGEAAGFDRRFRQAGFSDRKQGSKWAASAVTDYGLNGVMVSMSGVSPRTEIHRRYRIPFTRSTLGIDLESRTAVSALSVWDELFLVTPSDSALIGEAGTLRMFVTLSGSFHGESAGYGYSLSSDDGAEVLSDQSWQHAPGDTGVRTLAGTFGFIVGEPLPLTSCLEASLGGNGLVDLSRSAVVTGIEIPEHMKITFLSGAPEDAYGLLTGGDGYGVYGTAVPLPGAVWMLLGGLAFMAPARRLLGQRGRG